jgi:hypothetical protein
VITNSVQVYGVKSALKELNKINPKLRREYTKRYKDIVKPVVQAAKLAFPKSPPLSGMARPNTRLGGWDGGLVAKGVIAKIDTRKARPGTETVGAFFIVQKTGWGSIYDIAGRSNPGSQFVQNLINNGAPNASRAMWPAYEGNAAQVQLAVLDLVGEVMDNVNRNLVVNSGN